MIINAAGGSLVYPQFSKGTYTMDGVSNGKGFYKNDKIRDRYNDDRNLDPYLEGRYLHFSSIVNKWMVNTGYWIFLLPIVLD